MFWLSYLCWLLYPRVESGHWTGTAGQSFVQSSCRSCLFQIPVDPKQQHAKAWPYPATITKSSQCKKKIELKCRRCSRFRFAPEVPVICILLHTWTTKTTDGNYILACQWNRVDLYALPPLCVQRNCSPFGQEWSQNAFFSFSLFRSCRRGSLPASLRTEAVLREWMRESPQRPIFLRASSRKNADEFTSLGKLVTVVF